MPEIDLNATDSVLTTTQTNYENEELDQDEMTELEEPIIGQYINFESLGIDMIKTVPREYLLHILPRLIDYVNDNYLSIIDYDTVVVSPNKAINIGRLIYSFICLDNYFNILPSYLKKIDCYNIDQFDKYYKNNLNGDPAVFKASYINTMKLVIDRLKKLQTLKSDVTHDKNYQNLLNKYIYYIELINFGESDRFIENYIRPVLIKHFDDILWRTF